MHALVTACMYINFVFTSLYQILHVCAYLIRGRSSSSPNDMVSINTYTLDYMEAFAPIA